MYGVLGNELGTPPSEVRAIGFAGITSASCSRASICCLTCRCETTYSCLWRSPRAARALEGVKPAEEAARLLDALGIGERTLRTRRTDRLSIGQQQRVAAARALIGQPELLIADEPTSSLDEDTRANFLELLMAECARFGTSLLFVSHDRTLRGLFDYSVELNELNSATPATSAA